MCHFSYSFREFHAAAHPNKNPQAHEFTFYSQLLLPWGEFFHFWLLLTPSVLAAPGQTHTTHFTPGMISLSPWGFPATATPPNLSTAILHPMVL